MVHCVSLLCTFVDWSVQYEWCVLGIDQQACGGVNVVVDFGSFDGTDNLILGQNGANTLSSASLDEVLILVQHSVAWNDKHVLQVRIYGDVSSGLQQYNSYLEYDQVPTLRAYWKYKHL